MIIQSLRIYLFLSVFLGFGYTLVMTALSQALFPAQANGSLIQLNGKIIGSILIAQKFENPKYFWPRPSAVDYNPLPSGGTNLSGTQEALKKSYLERTEKLKAANGEGNVPEILLSASGSGLDPQITIESALYQVDRIAKARNLEAQKVIEIVESHFKPRQFGFLGEPTVNVLALNLALDGGVQ